MPDILNINKPSFGIVKDPVLPIEHLLAAIFVMLKILRLLFAARIELFNNNGRLASFKIKTKTEAREA